MLITNLPNKLHNSTQSFWKISSGPAIVKVKRSYNEIPNKIHNNTNVQIKFSLWMTLKTVYSASSDVHVLIEISSAPKHGAYEQTKHEVETTVPLQDFTVHIC